MDITPESVQRQLQSSDFGDRLRAVNHLRQLDPSVAFNLIQLVISDPSARVRYAAVSQLASLGEQNPDLALELLRDRLLNDSEIDVQAAAADSLGALKLTDAFEDLKTLYYSTSEWLLQFSIIAALGALGDPRVFDILAHALEQGSELTKTAAIGSFGELGDPRAIPLLAPYISDPDWQIRFRLAQALQTLGGAEAETLLATLSQDATEPVAQAARTVPPTP